MVQVLIADRFHFEEHPYHIVMPAFHVKSDCHQMFHCSQQN